MGPEDLGSALHRLFVLAAKCPELRPAICGSVALRCHQQSVLVAPVDPTAKLCGLSTSWPAQGVSADGFHGFDEALSVPWRLMAPAAVVAHVACSLLVLSDDAKRAAQA